MYWQNSWVYPVSFMMWRFRQFISTFAAITVWVAIFQTQQSAFGYSRDSMISYIFLTGFLQSMILATQTGGLAQQIYAGEISNTLLKPLNIFGAFIVQELSDKFLNFSFVIIETIILIQIFHPVFVLPPLSLFLLFLITVILGAVLLFFMMLLLGTLGFWSPDTWGPRFLFYIFVDFTAGKLFPLNIFPKILQDILALTPFPYLTYAQTQIFLQHASSNQILKTFLMLGFWIVVIASAFSLIWRKGIKDYGAAGH